MSTPCSHPQSNIEGAQFCDSFLAIFQVGVNLNSSMLTRKGRTKFTIVAVDYFTKWAEAELFAKISEQKITDFIWKFIVCRFGIPYSIVIDNGKQFENARLINFCEELDIKKHFSR